MPAAEAVGRVSDTVISSVSKPMMERTGPNLLARSAACYDIDEDGQLTELAARIPRQAGFPQRARCFRLHNFDVVEHLLVLRRRHDRADICVSVCSDRQSWRIAQFEQARHQPVLDRVLHKQPRSGDARLARRREDAGDDADAWRRSDRHPRDDVEGTFLPARARPASGCARRSHRPLRLSYPIRKVILATPEVRDPARCRSRAKPVTTLKIPRECRPLRQRREFQRACGG